MNVETRGTLRSSPVGERRLFVTCAERYFGVLQLHLCYYSEIEGGKILRFIKVTVMHHKIYHLIDIDIYD